MEDDLETSFHIFLSHVSFPILLPLLKQNHREGQHRHMHIYLELIKDVSRRYRVAYLAVEKKTHNTHKI